MKQLKTDVFDWRLKIAKINCDWEKWITTEKQSVDMKNSSTLN